MERIDSGDVASYSAGMKEAFGRSIPITLDDVCSPSELALVVYDMQVGIVRQVKDGAAVTTRVKHVLYAARAARVRTFFTRHMSLPKELMGSSAYRMAMAWQKKDDPQGVEPWFLRDSPGFGITPELTPNASEAIFDKLAMSAFEGTPLAFALRDCGVRAVAFVGIALEIGIEPSCRHAADLGFIPIVVRDACGFGHEEAAERSIAGLEFAGDTIVTDVESICARLR